MDRQIPLLAWPLCLGPMGARSTMCRGTESLSDPDFVQPKRLCDVAARAWGQAETVSYRTLQSSVTMECSSHRMTR